MNLAKVAARTVAVMQGHGGGGPAEVVAAGVVVGTAANQNLTLVHGRSSREPKLDGRG